MRSRLIQPTSAHVVLMAFLLGASAALLTGVYQVLFAAEGRLRSSLSAVVFLQPTVTDERAAALEATIRERDAQITSLMLVTKAAALQEGQQDPSLAKSLQVLKDNPLPASYTVQWRDEAWAARSEPGEVLRTLPEVQEIRWDAQAQASFRSVRAWREWMARLSSMVLGLFAVWTLIGLYEFFSREVSFGALAARVGLGAAGGLLSIGAAASALAKLPSEVFIVRPSLPGILPVLIGGVVGAAYGGWGACHEE